MEPTEAALIALPPAPLSPSARAAPRRAVRIDARVRPQRDRVEWKRCGGRGTARPSTTWSISLDKSCPRASACLTKTGGSRGISTGQGKVGYMYGPRRWLRYYRSPCPRGSRPGRGLQCTCRPADDRPRVSVSSGALRPAWLPLIGIALGHAFYGRSSIGSAASRCLLGGGVGVASFACSSASRSTRSSRRFSSAWALRAAGHSPGRGPRLFD